MSRSKKSRIDHIASKRGPVSSKAHGVVHQCVQMAGESILTCFEASGIRGYDIYLLFQKCGKDFELLIDVIIDEEDRQALEELLAA